MRYLQLSSTILALATGLPLLRVHNRWIRMLDFPRLQLAALCLLNLVLIGLGMDRSRSRGRWALLQGACLLYQAWKLHPFTLLKPVESKPASPGPAPSESFSLLTSNVRMSNRKSGKLLDLIGNVNPDLILLVEPDSWWEGQLRCLDRQYPWQVKVPQDNTYGMILLSRLPLRQTRVDRRLHPDIPSIQADVDLPSGETFRFYGVHPRPPAEEDTEDRDAELYLVGSELRGSGLPGVVAGDLNDVAWSRTTRLFQKVSGTLDPRVGRGFFNTFHAGIPILRYSLDHVFHSREFSLLELRRLGKIGSDHFPILLQLRFDHAVSDRPQPPHLEPGERDSVRETVIEARSDPDPTPSSG